MMKYFKYLFYGKVLKRIKKVEFQSLAKKEQRFYRFYQLSLIFFTIFFLFGFVFIYYLSFHMHEYFSSTFLVVVFKIILWLVCFPLLILFCLWIVYKLTKKHPEIPFQVNWIPRISEPLRKYYKVPQSGYLVTKCYFSSNSFMTNKDVLLYVYKGKIRICNNFYRSFKDFGCYEFDLEKLNPYNKIINGKVTTIIENEKSTFHLGYRAKTYILKQKIA